MLKIQGSTRSASGVQSSKLLWSLEENSEQANGLPREFTFVFLVEQTIAEAPLKLKISMKPVFSNNPEMIFCNQEVASTTSELGEEVGQKFSTPNFNFATMEGQLEDLVELPGVATNIQVHSHSSTAL